MRPVVGAALLGMLAACGTGARQKPADLILTGGAIHAADGWAEAVAVREGLVVAVGDDATVQRLRGSATRVIELSGATVFPGLHDAHAHPLVAAREQFQPCRIPPEPLAAVLEAVAACAEAAGSDEWVTSGPFSTSLLDAGFARAALDAAAPDNPVMIYAAGSHAFLLNSRALEIAGIDRSTPAPPGGSIERDAAGEPTGVLLDAWSLLPQPPPPDPELVAIAAAWALDRLLEGGVTSVTDAAADAIAWQAYTALADTGRLKPRVRVCRAWTPGDVLDPPPGVGSARDRLAHDCVKIFVDGESATARTAALLAPYRSQDGSPTDERGALAVSLEALTAAVTRFDRDGVTVKLHAWGDAAVAAALTAIEAARSANGVSGPRHEIGHVVVARAEDIERARAAGAVLEFSPWLWFPPAGPFVFRNLGEARMARAWPVRDALEAGAAVVGGTDWPTAPGRSPWAAIETLVTRLEPDRIELPVYRFGPKSEDGTAPFAPGQRITLEQAIAMFTANPAAVSGQPDAPGIIAVGRKADLVVLDRNPFDVPITDVHRTTAVTTIVGGEVVYDSATGNVP